MYTLNTLTPHVQPSIKMGWISTLIAAAVAVLSAPALLLRGLVTLLRRILQPLIWALSWLVSTIATVFIRLPARALTALIAAPAHTFSAVARLPARCVCVL